MAIALADTDPDGARTIRDRMRTPAHLSDSARHSVTAPRDDRGTPAAAYVERNARTCPGMRMAMAAGARAREDRAPVRTWGTRGGAIRIRRAA